MNDGNQFRQRYDRGGMVVDDPRFTRGHQRGFDGDTRFGGNQRDFNNRFDTQFDSSTDDRFLGNSRNTRDGQRGFDGDPRFRGNSQNLRTDQFRGNQQSLDGRFDNRFDNRLDDRFDDSTDDRFLGNSRNTRDGQQRGFDGDRRFRGNSQNLRDSDQFDEIDHYLGDEDSNDFGTRRID